EAPHVVQGDSYRAAALFTGRTLQNGDRAQAGRHPTHGAALRQEREARGALRAAPTAAGEAGSVRGLRAGTARRLPRALRRAAVGGTAAAGLWGRVHRGERLHPRAPAAAAARVRDAVRG